MKKLIKQDKTKTYLKRVTVSVLALALASNFIFLNLPANKQNVLAAEPATPAKSQVEQDKEELNSEKYENLVRTSWQATLTDADGKSANSDEVKKLFDGSKDTFVSFEGTDKKEPITLEIDLGAPKNLQGFSVDKRPGFDNKNSDKTPQLWGLNGTMNEYQIQTSKDKMKWDDVTTGTFTREDYKLRKEQNIYNVGDTVYKKFAKPVTARYIKIIQKSNHNVYRDHEFTSSELNIYTLTAEEEFKEKHQKILSKDSVTINEGTEIDEALADFESLTPKQQENLKDLKTKLTKFKKDVTNLTAVDEFKKNHSKVLEAKIDNVDVEELKKAIESYNTQPEEIRNLLKNQTIVLSKLIKEVKEKGQGKDLPELKLTDEFKKKEEKEKIDKFLETNKDLLEKEVEEVSPAEKEKIQELIKLLDSLSEEEQEKLNNEKEKLKSFLVKIKQGEDEATTNQFKNEHKDILGKTEEQIQVSDKEKVEKALQAIESANEEVKASLAKEKEKLEKLKEKITELEKQATKPAPAPSEPKPKPAPSPKPETQDDKLKFKTETSPKTHLSESSLEHKSANDRDKLPNTSANSAGIFGTILLLALGSALIIKQKERAYKNK